MISDDQIEKAKRMRWYHALDFGAVQTRGRFKPPSPPNMTLFGVMDLLRDVDVTAMKCLDIGPAHGLISFRFALKGAQVTAINIAEKKPPQIELAEEIFDVSIDYRTPISLEQVRHHFADATFDLIVCAGVMYHLINPADVFFRLRHLLKRRGLLVAETVYQPNSTEPVLVLNSEAYNFPQPTTYFIPTASALTGMAKLACFNTLATRSNSPSRFSMICRADLPDEILDRSTGCEMMHNSGIEDPSFQINALQSAPQSTIVYSGFDGHRDIDVRNHTPDFAPHPKVMNNVVGAEF